MAYVYYVDWQLGTNNPLGVYRDDADTLVAERYDRELGWVPDTWFGAQLMNGNIGPSSIVSEAEALKIIADIRWRL